MSPLGSGAAGIHRPLLVVASRNEGIAAALTRVLPMVLGQRLSKYEVRGQQYASFDELVAALDGIGPTRLRDTVLLLDVVSEPAAWSSAGDEPVGLAVLVALAFPEVYVVFLGFPSDMTTAISVENSHREWIDKYHFLRPHEALRIAVQLRIHASGFRTMFDPLGLRATFKLELFQRAKPQLSEVRKYEPFSKWRFDGLAAVADEEIDFVYLNGMAAYKAGYRAWTLSTEAEFNRLLYTPTQSAGTEFKAPIPTLVVTDRDLAFVDQRDSAKSRFFEDRIGSEERTFDVIMITGVVDKSVGKDLAVPSITVVPKPYAGLFGLFQILNVSKKENPLATSFGKFEVGLQEWHTLQVAPRISSVSQGGQRDDTKANHAAPGGLSSVAAVLIRRARDLRAAGATDTVSCVQTAVLACEAKEILGGLSRTTWYEAVALQNEAEVQAEVSFYGTSNDIEVVRRLEFIEKEIGYNKAGSGGHLHLADLNCLMQIANNLRLEFAEREQFAASEACLKKFAWYQRKLDKGRFGYFRRWARAYLDIVTDTGTSVSRLLLCSAGWIVVFGIVYSVLLLPDVALVGHTFLHAALTFLTLQPGSDAAHACLSGTATASDGSWWESTRVVLYWVMFGFELFVACLHMGLLVTVLYQRIARRAS